MRSVALCTVVALAAPGFAQPVSPGTPLPDVDAPPSVATEPAPLKTEAASVKTVEQLHAQGVALFKAQRFKAALVRFEEAQALLPDPVLTYNIGRCREALGELEAARLAYQAVAAAPEAPAELQERAITRKKAVDSALELAAKEEPAPPAPAPEPGVEPSDLAAVVPPSEPSNALAWSLIGVGAAAGLAGGIGAFMGLQDHGELEDAVSGKNGRISQVKARSLDKDGKTKKLWGGVAAGVGLTMVGVGVALFAASDEPADGVKASVVPSGGGAHGSIEWRF